VAIRDRALHDGVSIRAGVHSGEVELVGDDIAGVTVHEAARVAAAAGRDEILVSEATRLLAGGVPYAFEARGPFELKGLPGARTLYAVSAPESVPN
jgi:class 3 adenylate cyclase